MPTNLLLPRLLCRHRAMHHFLGAQASIAQLTSRRSCAISAAVRSVCDRSARDDLPGMLTRCLGFSQQHAVRFDQLICVIRHHPSIPGIASAVATRKLW
jgi:hypothetical protein